MAPTFGLCSNGVRSRVSVSVSVRVRVRVRVTCKMALTFGLCSNGVRSRGTAVSVTTTTGRGAACATGG